MSDMLTLPAPDTGAAQPGPAAPARRNRSTLKGEPGRRKRRVLAWRDGARCFYCHLPFPDPQLAGATFDHYVPYSVLRVNEAWNLVLACGPCNGTKADAFPPTLALLLTPTDPTAYANLLTLTRVAATARTGIGAPDSGPDPVPVQSTREQARCRIESADSRPDQSGTRSADSPCGSRPTEPDGSAATVGERSGWVVVA